MRAVVQRVIEANVKVDGNTVGEIKNGILVLLAVNNGDDESVFEYMLGKLSKLRIFEDENGKMNLSVTDKGYSILIVPNFTVYADARKGTRPSFVGGASPKEAKGIFESFCEYTRNNYPKCAFGIFGADMKVSLINDGPVTLIIDSDKIV